MGDSNVGATVEWGRTGTTKDSSGAGSRGRSGSGVPPVKGRGRVGATATYYFSDWALVHCFLIYNIPDGAPSGRFGVLFSMETFPLAYDDIWLLLQKGHLPLQLFFPRRLGISPRHR